MLPNFICPGASKSATTWLYSILTQHPEVYLNKEVKELNFFTMDYEKGIKKYERFFTGYKNEKIVGDISCIYFIDSRVPKRIYDTLGSDIKFIFQVRHPVKRAFSQYQMAARKNKEPLSFEEAISKSDEDRRKQSAERFSHPYAMDYLGESFYGEALERYLEYFPMSNIKIVVFEEMIADPENAMKDIFSFLGIDADAEINLDVNKNKPKLITKNVRLAAFIHKMMEKSTGLTHFMRKLPVSQSVKDKLMGKKEIDYKDDMNEETKIRLFDYYKDDIVKLGKLTSRNYDLWK